MREREEQKLLELDKFNSFNKKGKKNPRMSEKKRAFLDFLNKNPGLDYDD